jgi:hypothetical protein
MHVQARDAARAVERLDAAVAGRLARSIEVDLDRVMAGPQIERTP